MVLVLLILLAAIALFPIGDDNSGRRTTPYVTYTLLAVNVLAFFLLQGGGTNERFTYGYSVVPREIMAMKDYTQPVMTEIGPIPQAPGPSPIYLTLLTAMFMHGSIMHLFGNMLYLWIFGDNIEDAMGHIKFLLFYLLCGLLATGAHIFFEQNSFVPSLGASGAIAGVLGGYLLLYPRQTVRVLVGWVGIIQMPAIVVIGLWAALQFVNGFGSAVKTEQTGGGVAYMAHIGGFIAGLVLVNIFRNPIRQAIHGERVHYPSDMWNRR